MCAEHKRLKGAELANLKLAKAEAANAIIEAEAIASAKDLDYVKEKNTVSALLYDEETIIKIKKVN